MEKYEFKIFNLVGEEREKLKNSEKICAKFQEY
jgi:hypothetical protein